MIQLHIAKIINAIDWLGQCGVHVSIYILIRCKTEDFNFNVKLAEIFHQCYVVSALMLCTGT